MRKFWGRQGPLISLLLVVLLLLSPVVGTPALAATTADIAVNATPAYVEITNSPSTYGFGTVAVSTNYSTDTVYFNITNTSSVNIDVAISTNATWAGGNTWTHSDAGTPGSTTAAMSATPGTAAWNIIVKNATPNDLYTNTAATPLSWGLRLAAPTVFDDGVLKTNTVTLTATAS